MPKMINHTGQRFGKLTVIQRGTNNKWVCICDCGKEHHVTGSNLRNNSTKSCGCHKKEKQIEWGKTQAKTVNTTHGHVQNKTPSKTWHTWKGMKARCTNPNATSYDKYGGRGITVCKRWLESFENFLEDMGERPEGTTIDRIDVNGNYEPSNCRWATPHQQNINRRKKTK